MEKTQTFPKVLLFPFLAHGHINPFLELGRVLSNHHFKVYLCSTPVNLEAISRKVDDYSINPVEIHLQSSPELPPHYHTTKGLPPRLMATLHEAFQNCSPSFSEILENLQPDLVIYDIAQSWVPPIAASYNIPSVYYHIFGTAAICFLWLLHKGPALEFPTSTINITESEWDSFTRVEMWNADKEEEYILRVLEQSNEIVLVRSSMAFEEKYLETTMFEKKMVPVGSLISEPEEDLDDVPEIIKWLNEKKKGSTVYVSIGSECFFTKEEFKELALGLELSNVNFIWVTRSPEGEKAKLEDVLPEGFLDRTKGRGFIEEVWAPQAKILKHPSIGGFVCHCGWNSVVESMAFGVPIIAIPMQYEQPISARLAVECGVGLEVPRGENGCWNGDDIGRIIQEVVCKDEGEAIRRKSRELAESMKVESRKEEAAALHELMKICYKNNISLFDKLDTEKQP